MNNDELKDLIDNISIEIGKDAKFGISTTKVKLKETEKAPEIIAVLQEKFEHYKSVNLIGDQLVIKHPDQDSDSEE